ncbi:MAG: zinc ABC transporter substrate-binding protein [Verrucomicrobia bacterium]|nr:zinc ABC transporter substrate-binding protein [Verrucomicrobiota bacterium]
MKQLTNALLTAAWISLAAHGGEKLRVVTTATDLAAIARYIGGERAEVSSIATGREDPHHIAAKPSYMLAAHNADLWIRVGMELEIGYEPPILEGARNPKILPGSPGHLDASLGALRLEVPTQRIDRSMGDLHPEGNPHYLLDPLNGRIVAKAIAARMARLRPADADYFAERLKAFQEDLDERMFGKALVKELGGANLWVLLLRGRLEASLRQPGRSKLGGWLGLMRPLRGRKLITYHRSWSYFVHRFGLTVAMEVEPKPGIPPTPARLTELISRIKAERIRVLLQAPHYSRKAGEMLARETGIRIVVAAMFPGGEPQVKDYFDVFDNLTGKLEKAFRD